MKHIFLLFLVSILLFQCKKDTTEDPAPDPQIASIVGKWRYAGYEAEENGKKVWRLQTGAAVNNMFIRYDGVMLDSKGFRPCCSSGAYNLNGVVFQINPKAETPTNPSCVSVDCFSCETLQMDQNGDELIITYCITGGRSKYVRD